MTLRELIAKLQELDKEHGKPDEEVDMEIMREEGTWGDLEEPKLSMRWFGPVVRLRAIE